MELVEPVLHVAEGADKAESRLGECRKTTSRASSYFWRSSMRACCSDVGESWAGAPAAFPAPLPISSWASTLFSWSGDLLLEAGDLSLGVELAQAGVESERR